MSWTQPTFVATIVAWPGFTGAILAVIAAVAVPLVLATLLVVSTNPVGHAQARMSWHHTAQLLGPWRRALRLLPAVALVHAIYMFQALVGGGLMWAAMVAGLTLLWSRFVYELVYQLVEDRVAHAAVREDLRRR